MLTQANIEAARRLFDERKTAQRVRDLVTTQRVALMAGDGKDSSEIVLSAGYLAKIIADVTASLDQQIANANQALVDMGVEP
ncbi:hypothetical protein ASD12_18245 [Mesorhizobium sp. Root102]|uniref:hypothetical protein n=1 Tax=Mesorhizobium sp. Root102 TaxID=1736422 RepID=UPI0006FC25BF|nr:hypothetical protein [Mesorhizobium sp. Root102]KQU77741.1 hypothetical protein ASD12_18245 [Mesorhizobium sp. Root102]